MDDSLKRTNGETDSLKKTAVSNRYAQYMRDENMSQESPEQSTDEEEEEEKSSSPVPLVSRVSSLPKSPSLLIPSNEVQQDSLELTNLTYAL